MIEMDTPAIDERFLFLAGPVAKWGNKLPTVAEDKISSAHRMHAHTREFLRWSVYILSHYSVDHGSLYIIWRKASVKNRLEIPKLGAYQRKNARASVSSQHLKRRHGRDHFGP